MFEARDPIRCLGKELHRFLDNTLVIGTREFGDAEGHTSKGMEIRRRAGRGRHQVARLVIGLITI